MANGIDLETETKGDYITVKGRSVIPMSVKDETGYVTIHPVVHLSGKDQFVSLSEQTPVSITSERQALSVTIEEIKMKDDAVTIDYQVNDGDDKGKGSGFIKEITQTMLDLVNKSEKASTRNQ